MASSFLACALLSVLAVAAQAQMPPLPGSIIAVAKLSAAPGVTSKGKGTVTLQVGPPGSMHYLWVNLTGAVDNAIMAHIHMGSVTSPGGIKYGSLPAVQSVSKLSPALSYSGKLTWMNTFTAADLVSWAPAGTTPADAEMMFLNYLLMNKDGKSYGLYFNVHTTAHPSGEINGNFKCKVKGCAPIVA